MPGLIYRPIVIAGQPAADDYEFFWHDLPVGRAFSRKPLAADWWFTVNFWGLPWSAGYAGTARNFEDCHDKVLAGWKALEATLMVEDIARAYEIKLAMQAAKSDAMAAVTKAAAHVVSGEVQPDRPLPGVARDAA